MMEKNLKELLRIGYIYSLKFNPKTEKFVLEIGPKKNLDTFDVIGESFAGVVKEALAELKK